MPGAQAPPAAGVPNAAPAQSMAQEGLQAKARLQIILARKVLEAVLPVLGSDSEEGKSVTKALTALAAISRGEAEPKLLESEAASLRQVAAPAPQPVGRPQSQLGMPMPGMVGGVG